MLSYGNAVLRYGRDNAFLRAELPRILAAPSDVLSPPMVRLIENLAGDWRRLDERIEGLLAEIEILAREDAGCARLMSVPRIGPIISSATVALEVLSPKAANSPPWGARSQANLDRGPNDPEQDIKRCNRYLRVLFVQAARSC